MRHAPSMKRLTTEIVSAALPNDIASYKAILAMWEAEMQLVEEWLTETHPEFVTDSGRTSLGELLALLERKTAKEVMAINDKLPWTVQRPFNDGRGFAIADREGICVAEMLTKEEAEAIVYTTFRLYTKLDRVLQAFVILHNKWLTAEKRQDMNDEMDALAIALERNIA